MRKTSRVCVVFVKIGETLDKVSRADIKSVSDALRLKIIETCAISAAGRKDTKTCNDLVLKSLITLCDSGRCKKFKKYMDLPGLEDIPVYLSFTTIKFPAKKATINLRFPKAIDLPGDVADILMKCLLSCKTNNMPDNVVFLPWYIQVTMQ